MSGLFWFIVLAAFAALIVWAIWSVINRPTVYVTDEEDDILDLTPGMVGTNAIGTAVAAEAAAEMMTAVVEPQPVAVIVHETPDTIVYEEPAVVETDDTTVSTDC